jgi:hypothetical protein
MRATSLVIAFYLLLNMSLGFVFIASAHADPAPVRCKDVSGAFGVISHVCQFPDGSVTTCIAAGVPTLGPPCAPVNVALAPNFWNTP